MEKYKHLLITGGIRSGTTYVGDVLNQLDHLRLINEPFSKNHGIKGIKHWNPYSNNNTDYYSIMIKDFLDLKSKFSLHQRKTTDLVYKSIFKSRSHLTYSIYKYTMSHLRGKELIIKDPLASLLSKRMREDFDIGIIVLFRHPGAFFHSNKRLGWDFDLNNIFDQEKLVDDYLIDEFKYFTSKNKKLHYVERISMLWRCINKVLLSFKNELNEEKSRYWLNLTHEELCENPIAFFNKIFKMFELKTQDSISEYILNSTSVSNKVSVTETHVLKRNSKELINYWKNDVSNFELATIRRLTEDVASHVYQNDSWG